MQNTTHNIAAGSAYCAMCYGIHPKGEHFTSDDTDTYVRTWTCECAEVNHVHTTDDYTECDGCGRYEDGSY